MPAEEEGGRFERPRGDRIFRAIASGAPWWLALVALVTLLAGLAIVDPTSGRLRIELDPSVDSMLPQDDPGRAYFEEVKARFGTGESVLVVLFDEDVFTAENLRRTQRITERIEALDPVERVSSLSASLNIRSEAGTLVVEPFYDEVPTSPEALADLRRRALADPIYAGNLVSRDGRASLINVHLLDVSEQELLASGLDEEISRIAEEESGRAEVWIAGSPHVNAEITRLMLDDLKLLVPISWIVMAGVAFASFRTLRGVLIPIITVQLSLVWTLAFVALAYGSLNMITVAAPPILVVVGLAYAIHMIAAYYDVLRGVHGPWRDRRDAVRLALHHVALPVVFTGFTTAAGFFALTTSPLTAIAEFGIFCGVGVLATMLVSLSFAPALLCLLPVPRRVVERRTGDGFDRFLARLARFDTRHRRAILAAGAVLGVLALLGMTRIEVSSRTVTNFKPDNPVRIHFDLVNAQLEGANAFRVVLESSVQDAFKEPENLRSIEALQSWVESQPEVGGTTSLVDYVKTINRGFHEDDPNTLVIPESRQLVSQLLLIGANDELDQFVDTDYRMASVLVRTRATDSADVAALVERIEGRLVDLPEHLKGVVTGNTVLLSRTLDDIALGQVLSLGTAFLIIYAVLVLLFTSFRTGLLALIPNALPVLIYFGILGWFGVALDATTGLVACVVLGIAVDDTIHLMVHFNQASRRHADESRGVVDALRSVARPVTYTTIALCLGFLSLIFSGMESQFEFGVLAAVTLAFAWLIDMTFTPSLALGMHIVTIWDVLTLDLGAEPHRSIPVFRGLRHTEARVVALMSSLHSLPQGHQLTRVGEKSSEMYVVIDGELEASISLNGRTVNLRTHRRGDVLGEVGMFYGERTADVRALTNVRLLRVTEDSLSRLARRHPRIGARIYANLSRVLAARLANLTTRVS